MSRRLNRSRKATACSARLVKSWNASGRLALDDLAQLALKRQATVERDDGRVGVSERIVSHPNRSLFLHRSMLLRPS